MDDDAVVPFHIVIVVWGATYVDLMLSVTVPMLLAPGNIPALPNREASEVLICTTPEDEAAIRASTLFAQLAAMITVTFHHLPDGGAHKYDRMTQGHHIAMQRAAGRGVCIFLGPDAAFSDGMLLRLYNLWKSGKRIVAGYGPRLAADTFVPALKQRVEYTSGMPLAMPPRQLVALAMQHLHFDVRAHWVDSPHYPRRPYMCVWSGPDGDGMLIRPFNLHPYLFDCRALSGKMMAMVIDWNFIPNWLENFNELWVETDSDGFNIWGLSPTHVREMDEQPNSFSHRKVALWLVANNHHIINRVLSTYALRYHACALTPAWDALIAKSRGIAWYFADTSFVIRTRGVVERTVRALCWEAYCWAAVRTRPFRLWLRRPPKS